MTNYNIWYDDCLVQLFDEVCDLADRYRWLIAQGELPDLDLSLHNNDYTNQT